MTRGTKFAVGVGVVLGWVSCESPEEKPTTATVPVVESQNAAWNSATAWYVDPEPEVTIGVADGDPVYQFYRVYGALRLGSGVLAISNAGSSEIRLFDQSGEFVRAVGRRGEGPGEFGEFSSLRMCSVGGRLVVEDGAGGRFHVFEESGDFVETVILTGGTGRPAILGCFEDGSLLTVMGGQALEGAPGDIIRLQTNYHRYAASGEYANSLAVLDGRPRYVNELEGVTHYPFVPLTSAPQATSGGAYFYATDGGDAAVTKYDSLGGPVVEIRWDPGPRERVSEVWDRYKRESLDGMESERDLRLYTHFYAQDLPLPEFVPVIQTLNVDREGNLWIERYRLEWETEGEWAVISPEGQYLGELRMPANLRVLDIGPDYVLGRHLDELNVERIHMHRLVKPAAR